MLEHLFQGTCQKADQLKRWKCINSYDQHLRWYCCNKLIIFVCSLCQYRQNVCSSVSWQKSSDVYAFSLQALYLFYSSPDGCNHGCHLNVGCFKKESNLKKHHSTSGMSSYTSSHFILSRDMLELLHKGHIWGLQFVWWEWEHKRIIQLYIAQLIKSKFLYA